MSVRVGVLLRHEDESGVSGTGVVADIFEYPDGWCVMHWRSNTPSTNIYPNTKAMTAVHSHGGKTEIVFYAEIDSPRNEEELSSLMNALASKEEAEKEREQLVEDVAEEVAEKIKGRVEELVETATEEAVSEASKKSRRAARKAVRTTEGESA